MRIATVTFLAGLGLAAASASAGAAPLAPERLGAAPGIVKVWGGCGPGFHPVPGHWSRWRGWVPPHCVPHQPYGPYAGWHPYWRHHYWR